MQASHLGLFCAATVLMSLSPGPNVFLMLALGLREGGASVLKAAAGIALASLGFLLVSALGLVAALTASAVLFSAVSYLGAAYLAYLGLRMILASRGHDVDATLQSRPLARPFVQGVVTHLANPKAMLYWSALFPQFVDASRPLTPQVLLLGLIGITIDVILLSAYGLSAARARRGTISRRLERLTHLVGGSFFVIVALLLAAARLNASH